MSKEYLEALERLKTAPSFMGGTAEYQFCTKSETLLMQDYETVKQALKRLESIDNADSNEALECLESIEADLTGLPKHVTEYDDGFDNYLEDIWNNIDTIKQVLLKAQDNARSEEILQKYYQEGITLDSVRALKQEKDYYKKVLEIIKEKDVDIYILNHCKTVDEYNSKIVHIIGEIRELTQEEFNLLKEVLDDFHL